MEKVEGRMGAQDGRSSRSQPTAVFQRLIIPAILKEKKMSIPTKFMEKYGSELVSFATLNLPDGKYWLVGLSSKDGKVWFDQGWQEFVDYYSLRAGHLLFFTYEERTNFFVQIYDLTNAELKYPDPTPQVDQLEKPSERNRSSEKDVVEVIILDSGPPSPAAGAPSSHLSLANGLQFSEDKGKQILVDGGLSAIAEEARSGKRLKGSVAEPMAELRLQVQPIPVEVVHEVCTRRWRAVTPEERRRAVAAADMFSPPNPYFKVVLQPSYTYRGFLMHIPSSFSKHYLNGVEGMIMLQVAGVGQWPVKCHTLNGAAKLTKGWTEFVWANKLEEGDVLVFELLSVDVSVFRVKIFRVLEEAQAAPVPRQP